MMFNSVEKNPRQQTFSEKLLSLFLRALPIKHGKHRLLDKIAPISWIKNDQPILLSLNGKKIIIDPNDLVGWHFSILKSFDPEVVEILEKSCNHQHKEVLWDIGANKGACSFSLASKLPLLQVVAVEPQSLLSTNNIKNFQLLCPNRYEYIQAGIGEKEAELTLTIPKSNMGKASLHIEQKSPEDYIEKINILTASQIAESSRFGWPTIVKIDVEGHEPFVFRSLALCFSTKKCKALVFENHQSETKAFEVAKAVVEPYGYKIYGIKKSPWSTRLVPANGHLPNITDYAVIRSDLIEENSKLKKLIS